MSANATILTFHKMRRFDSPQFLLGAGFAAGLLVFFAWLSHLPNHDKHAVRARGNGAIVATVGKDESGGVLSGITGDASHGSKSGVSGDDGSSFFDEENVDTGDTGDTGADAEAEASVDDAYAAGDADTGGNNMAVGDSVGAPPAEGGAALTDSLLDSPPAADAGAPVAAAAGSAPGAPLQAYYVEVEVAPGDVQVLQLNAESPEHARAILRDFRGDPRILRGPSTEPLR